MMKKVWCVSGISLLLLTLCGSLVLAAYPEKPIEVMKNILAGVLPLLINPGPAGKSDLPQFRSSPPMDITSDVLIRLPF